MAGRVAQWLQLTRRRHRDLPRQAVTATDTEVAGGPNVDAAELEHEEHLGRPATYAPDGGKGSDQLLVVLPGQPAVGSARRSHRRVLAARSRQRSGLVGGQANGPKGLVRKGQERPGLDCRRRGRRSTGREWRPPPSRPTAGIPHRRARARANGPLRPPQARKARFRHQTGDNGIFLGQGPSCRHVRHPVARQFLRVAHPLSLTEVGHVMARPAQAIQGRGSLHRPTWAPGPEAALGSGCTARLFPRLVRIIPLRIIPYR